MARVLDGRNRASPEEAGSFVDQYEELEREVASEKASYMERCRRIRERQGEVLDDAKSQGVPKKVVKAIVKAREHERKATDIRDDLEDDQKEQFIDIRKALGDFADSPLGAAAVGAEDQQDETTAAIVGATREATSEDEWDNAAPPADDPETAEQE